MRLERRTSVPACHADWPFHCDCGSSHEPQEELRLVTCPKSHSQFLTPRFGRKSSNHKAVYYLYIISQGGDPSSVSLKRQCRSLLPTMELRETQAPLAPSSPTPHPPTPSPTCLTLMPTPAVQEELIQGEGKQLFRPFPFLCLGLSLEGSAGQSRRGRKKGRKEIPTSRQERDCLLEMLPAPPWVL